MHRHAHTLTVTLTAAITTLMTGCQPPSPPPPTPTNSQTSPSSAPSPVATPTYMCTPEAGGNETPCTKADHDTMEAKDALYTEAEAVYRRAFAENIRISRAGGVTEPTQVMLDTMHGFYLEDVLTLFRQQHDRGTKAVGLDPKIAAPKRLVGQSKAGSAVAIAFCVDATGWGFYKGDQRVSDGRIAVDDTYFSRVDGTLKMIGADGREVESCG